MRKVAFAWAVFALCSGVPMYAADQSLILRPQIAKYYQDLNYVAANSTPTEQMTIVS